MNFNDLPAAKILPDMRNLLQKHRNLIITAAPGAGKTTLVPAEMLDICRKNILLAEPRRIAARAAVCRIAAVRGEKVGDGVGYAVRGDSCRSNATRLLAVTPGVLLQTLQANPLLENIDAVIFDEFHERKWESDLALALVLDAVEKLSLDVKVIVMSATLDTAKLADCLQCPVLSADGRMFPVETVYSPIPATIQDRDVAIARAIMQGLKECEGNMLVFLPGVAEITKCAALLGDIPDISVEKLHGQLSLDEQNKILTPSPGRKVFLATNIAESSVTVPDVRIVVDCGREKRLRFSPGTGLSFLENVTISRHSADQRAGRAGRTAPGTAIRLYSQYDFERMPQAVTPEIKECDLLRFCLEIAEWGCDAGELHLPDAPDPANLESAQQILYDLGAVDARQKITPLGRKLVSLPVNPRIGTMLLKSESCGSCRTACDIAGILEENVTFSDSVDLNHYLDMLNSNRRGIANAVKLSCKLRNLMRLSGDDSEKVATGVLTGFAFPDWIAQRRFADEYVLSKGGTARIFDDSGNLDSEFLAVARLSSTANGSVIRLAAPLQLDDLEKFFADRISESDCVELNADGKASAFKVRRLGSIVLQKTPTSPPPGALAQALLAEAVKRHIALPPAGNKAAISVLQRVRFAGKLEKANYPDWSEKEWGNILCRDAANHLTQCKTIQDIEKADWKNILRQLLGENVFRTLEHDFPAKFQTPAGTSHFIDYSGEQPTAGAKVQEFYGVKCHPKIGKSQIPLRLELLSPAGRPVQTTSDLPGFWHSSWELVKKEMKSRYPKHFWPDDPENQLPASRTLKSAAKK